MPALLQKLVNIPSVTGDEGEIGVVLADMLSGYGFSVSRQAVDEKRFNVLALGQDQPQVLLCTHMDTVPPFIPFKRNGQTLLGRGVCDAKGALACMIRAGLNLLQHGIKAFGLLFVVGEETDSDGARTAAQSGLKVPSIVLGEPTQNRLAIGQKGTLVFRVRATGELGHSAYPDRARSAVHHMIDFLYRLQNTDWGQDDYFGSTTVNVGKLEGGYSANVISDFALAQGIFRVAQSCNRIESHLQSLADDRIKIDMLSKTEPQHLGRLPGYESDIVAFGSDAGHLSPMGRVFLIGPGSIEYAHQEHEQINLSELNRAIALYEKMVKDLIH